MPAMQSLPLELMVALLLFVAGDVVRRMDRMPSKLGARLIIFVLMVILAMFAMSVFTI